MLHSPHSDSFAPLLVVSNLLALSLLPLVSAAFRSVRSPRSYPQPRSPDLQTCLQNTPVWFIYRPSALCCPKSKSSSPHRYGYSASQQESFILISAIFPRASYSIVICSCMACPDVPVPLNTSSSLPRTFFPLLLHLDNPKWVGFFPLQTCVLTPECVHSLRAHLHSD